MKPRTMIDIGFVGISIVIFALAWLPYFRVFIFKPYAVPLLCLSFPCGVYLLFQLFLHGKKRVWLLLGIFPALYFPVLLFILPFLCALHLSDCP
jgi:hypothetical protein